MKRSEILSFVESFMEQRGARIARVGSDLLEVAVPADGGTGESPRAMVAFGARAHRANPQADLAAVGSAFLDRLVGEATAAGRHAVSFCAPPASEVPAPRMGRLPTLAGARWGRPKPAYRPQFLFVYVAEYRTIDVPDDLVLIGVDPARGEVLSVPGPLLEKLANGADQAPDGWMELNALPTPGAFWHSLAALDRRLRRRARKVKEAAALEIARETANIEAYYRQLIDEVRYPIGRGRLTPQNEADRVRALQLDWKRRVQEVARFWGAGASVRLSALGTVMEPCWAIPLRGRGPRGGKRGRGPVCLAADYTSGALLKPRCPLCGARIGDRAELVGADLVCPAHTKSSAGDESAETELS
jgi:hypothetical protein